MGDIAVKLLLTSSIIFSELPLLLLKFAVLLKVHLKKTHKFAASYFQVIKFINPNREQGK